MIFGIITLLVALTISGIAAYYSIVGLTAIFSAAVIPIIIMGAALEVGKIIAALWLKINWRRAGITYKLYLVPAVAVLMLLTSMGIFGFLSKAHSDQSLETSNADARIVIIDEKIRTERDSIEVARKALKQLDEQVDQVMSRSKDERGAERSAQIRRNQARERTKLMQDIEAAQKRIMTFNEERAPLAAEARKIESEVGPIKYIAALVYDDNPDQTILEKAVRLVIIIIVAVFDPLALVLILAAQQSIRWAREDRAARRQETIKSSAPQTPIVRNVDNQISSVAVDSVPMAPVQVPEESSLNIEKHAYLTKPWNWPPKSPIVVADAPVKETTQPIPEIMTEESKPGHDDKIESDTISGPRQGELETLELQRGHKAVPKEAAERPNLKKFNPSLSADNEIAKEQPVKAHFGISFPGEPEKGELYLRVDYYPSKLFKYNGNKWIEVDKNLTDTYVYNIDYIQYLLEEIKKGKIDPEELSPAERNQIKEYLNK